MGLVMSISARSVRAALRRRWVVLSTAGALVAAYFAQGHRDLAVRAYERCRAALEELGLDLSPWLEEVYATAAFTAVPSRSAPVPPPPAGAASAGVPSAGREELRTVSVLAAEVAASADLDPESLRDVVGRSLAAVITEVEALGGTVTSVSSPSPTRRSTPSARPSCGASAPPWTSWRRIRACGR